MVPVSATPQTLHLLAHQAQLRARTDPDWWDNPLDTALAAVSATRHPPAFRADGVTAVDRLRRWCRDGGPRRISADVAALSLAAAAAADLGVRDPGLLEAAVTAAEDLAQRERAVVPLLHLGMITWALDDLVPDRSAGPWLAIRGHLNRDGATHGIDAPIASTARAISAQVFDPARLVTNLLAEVPSSPTLEDGAVLLWLLTVGCERSARHLEQTDSGLLALADRRSELTLRMAQELDTEAFKAPEVADFDPDAELDRREAIYLSPLEALLIDISLASSEREHPWLRFDEAADVFGRRERRVRRTLARRTTGLLTAISVLSGVLIAFVVRGQADENLIAILAGVVVGSVLQCFAVGVWHRHDHSRTSQAMLTFFALLAGCAALDLVNESLTEPPFPDAAGVIAGLLIPALAAVLVALTSPRRPRAE